MHVFYKDIFRGRIFVCFALRQASCVQQFNIASADGYKLTSLMYGFMQEEIQPDCFCFPINTYVKDF